MGKGFFVARGVAGAVVVLWLTGCGTTRPLPAYEPPLARTEMQNVRTTAYTHTEADHVQYGQRNALGGTLQAAATALSPAAVTGGPQAYSEIPRDEDAGAVGVGGFQPPAGAGAAPMARAVPAYAVATMPPAAPLICGSAAADWSRWPAGTLFRILSTGQLYRVDDYGWALAGRNTIDLYMPSRAAMNAWAVRTVPIQIVQWGDRDESLRVLRGRDKFRHIHRMVLELEGERRAAARMR